MENQKVKRIQFDFFYKNNWYRDLTIDCEESDGVDKEYIHDEDGPWFMLPVGDDMIDFQVYSPDGDTLSIDACEMHEENGVYHHGRYLNRLDTPQSGKEYDFENIRVEYYPVPTQGEIYMMLLQSMDGDTAQILAQRMENYVVDDVLSCADAEYNDDDVRLAIGRYLREQLGFED